MNYVALGVVVSALILSGCELTLEIDLPDAEPALVVNGYFNPDSSWSIHLSNASSFGDGRTGIGNLSNATVSIIPDNGSQHISLHDVGGGVYEAPSVFPQIGVAYTLNVEANDYPSIQATDYVPEPVSARHAYEILDAWRSSFSGTWRVTAKVTAWLQDEPDRSDYYRVFVLVEPKTIGTVQQVNITVPDGSIMLESVPSEWFPDYEGYEGIQVSDVVFSDKSFDGDEVELSFQVQAGLDRCYDGPSEVEFEEDPCVLRVYLLRISEAYYRYAATYLLQRWYLAESSAEPLTVESNVENGLGIFAGYTAYTVELKVPDTTVARGIGRNPKRHSMRQLRP